MRERDPRGTVPAMKAAALLALSAFLACTTAPATPTPLLGDPACIVPAGVSTTETSEGCYALVLTAGTHLQDGGYVARILPHRISTGCSALVRRRLLHFSASRRRGDKASVGAGPRRAARALRAPTAGRERADRHRSIASQRGLRRSLASFRRSLASFRRSLASFRRSLASFRRSLASFRRSLASFRRSLASFRRSLASFRRSLASFRRSLASFRRSLASFRRDPASSWRGPARSRQLPRGSRGDPVERAAP